MPRHIYLGHHRDVALRAILQYSAHLRLGVVALVRLAVEVCVAAAAALAVKFGIGVALQPPPLIVGQVQMYRVELVQHAQIRHPAHVVDGNEVARGVEHHAAIFAQRAVLDEHVAHLAVRLLQDLRERDIGVKQALCAARDVDSASLYPDLAALVGQRAVPVTGHDERLFVRLFGAHELRFRQQHPSKISLLKALSFERDLAELKFRVAVLDGRRQRHNAISLHRQFSG